MSDKLKIGMRIKECREKAGLTQEELGNALGFNKSTIQRYESGAVEKIKIPVLEAIAVELGVNPEYLALKTNDFIDYANSEMVQNASSEIRKFFNGDAKKIYEFQTAIENSANNEFFDDRRNLLHNFGVDYREETLITKYRKLDPHGAKMVNLVLNEEYERCVAEQVTYKDNTVTVATAARNGGEPTIETITQEQYEALKKAKPRTY